MTRTLALLATLVSLIQSMRSGEDETVMVTDRPDFTESSSVVAPGIFQAEVGAGFARDSEGKTDVYNLPGGLVRYGIGRNGELRISSTYVVQRSDHAGNEITTNGVGGLMIGGKMNLLGEDPGIVELALLGHLHLPVGEKLFRPRTVEPEVILAVSRGITESINLGTNVGGRRNSTAGNILTSFSGVFGFSFSGNLGMFAEYFGFYSGGDSPSHNFDTGATWLIHPFVQLDISGGASPSGDLVDYFAGAGFSFRLGE